MKYSVSILKPDCIERGMEDTVRSMLEQNGFTILLEKKTRLSRNDILFIYERCVGKDFFEGLSSFLTSSDVIVLVVSNPNAADVIKKLNSLMGHTDPSLAKEGTIRKLGESIKRNLAHSSADATSAWREVSRLFSKEEIGKDLGL
mgnify:CR=1 FL=1